MTAVTSPSEAVPLSDAALAQVLQTHGAAGEAVLVVANGYTALVAAASASTWREVGRGDFGLLCGEVVKTLAGGGRLFWTDIAGSPNECDLTAVTPAPASTSTVDAWLAEANALTSSTGRGAAPRAEDLQYLGYLAGWRCQFAGCGKDLKRESLSGTPGNFSYFAHIIASSAKGPRGDKLLSGQRADDIENIMLMCDECHRRIDRVDPDRFTVDVLRTMRQGSINEVRRLLDTLQYEEALPIVVMGNITAQSPRFIQRDAEEAMWTRRLRMSPGGPEHFFNTGGHLHNPHAPHYWGSLFEALRTDIPLLRKRLNGTLRTDGTAMPLAVFPLHGTSLLVLAGRIFGEGSRVVPFQFNRDRPASAPGRKWAFDESAPAPPADKYVAHELAPHVGALEGCLLVSLTFKVSPSRLPKALFADGAFRVGAIEVTAQGVSLGHDIVAHPHDLDLFALALEQAVKTLQDHWKVNRVHLFIGAPASACFRIGQKMQARHHAIFVCYEAIPGKDGAFEPTIEIENERVTEPRIGVSVSLA